MMRPLLQHASRSLIANATPAIASSRSFGVLVNATPSTCLRCPSRAASTALRRLNRLQPNTKPLEKWLRRTISSSTRWMEEKKPPNPSQPIAMPPPASESKPAQFPEDTDISEKLSSIEKEWRRQQEEESLRQQQEAEKQRRQQEAESLRKQQEADSLRHRQEEKKAPESSERLSEGPSVAEAHERPQKEKATAPKKDNDADNIARVPDEQLPSHRERQRWSLSKRLNKAMDELLPKLAVVTQKVNTYTGTDYSGVAALRKEIKEQENLVKTRRLAIDSTKQALDTALAHQAASQKEVVALLERKHSWSSHDLERYMSLIRSEHINDQAVRNAKEAVADAESSLEEARARLEKRERAQYHEEQIWSDTIRRNSTWVTFGLMGVNIFLLLLSLAILEPWRRRRMVREIKSALEAQILAMGTAPASVAAVAPALAKEDLKEAEKEIEKVIEPTGTPVDATTPAVTESIVEEPPTAETKEATFMEPVPDTDAIPETLIDSTPDVAALGAAPLTSEDEVTPQESIDITDEVLSQDNARGKLGLWHQKVSAVAQDVVSDRIISIRRIDYTTAVLQGAAAGAIITAAFIAMLRPT